MELRSAWRNIGIAVIAASLAGASVILNFILRVSDVTLVEPPAERSKKWDPRLFKAITFGNLPAAIDWLWIHVLADDAVAHVQKGAHPPIYYDLDLATDLDPAFYDAYVAGANLLAVVRNDGLGARDLLAKAQSFRKNELPSYPESFGSDFWANSWNIPLLMAYVYLFELEDMPNAATAFKEASQVSGAPPYLLSLAARLNKPGGEYEVGIKLLGFMMTTNKDPRIKKQLERKRNDLVVAQYLFELNRSFRDYLEKQPTYKAATSVSQGQLSGFWNRFLKESRTPASDPWGGNMSVDEHGRVVSTTPYKPVFGLR